MRVFVLALMIVLLPLRGWMGDSMAMGSADHAMASASGAAETHCPDHAHTAPTNDHALPAMDHGGGHQEATSDTDGHAHDLCEVCNGPAMAGQVATQASGDARPGLSVARVEPFLSHLPLGEHKPPIA